MTVAGCVVHHTRYLAQSCSGRCREMTALSFPLDLLEQSAWEIGILLKFFKWFFNLSHSEGLRSIFKHIEELMVVLFFLFFFPKALGDFCPFLLALLLQFSPWVFSVLSSYSPLPPPMCFNLFPAKCLFSDTFPLKSDKCFSSDVIQKLVLQKVVFCSSFGGWYHDPCNVLVVKFLF